MVTKVDGNSGVLQSYDYQVLTTGFSYTFATGTTTLIANPAGTLATGTITMPGSPADGMVVTFMSTQEVTALTISGNSGQSIGGSQTAQLPANSAMSFVYRLTNTTWYRTTPAALGNVGTAPVYAARAWVNFNGTGTVAIRASGNVSSITDNGTGDYTVNFTTAMSDANYGFSISAGRYGATFPVPTGGRTTQPTTTSMRIYTTSADGTTGLDPEQVSFTVFR